MVFQALQMLSLSCEGRQIIISSSRHRSILAALLLWVNRPVPLSRLVAMIWEDQAPRTARQQVQNCLGSLRGLLRKEQVPCEIVCYPSAYALTADEREVDVAVFRRLISSGRQAAAAGDIAAAVTALAATLDLWSGTPCEELQTATASGDIAALAEDRLQALELLAALLIARGDYEQACLALCDIEQVYPYNERLSTMRATALQRSGRGGEAVVTLRRMRQRLRVELGIAPGPDLVRAERELLVPC
jgi:DNA-binding SARP family transcriptional activator